MITYKDFNVLCPKCEGPLIGSVKVVLSSFKDTSCKKIECRHCATIITILARASIILEPRIDMVSDYLINHKQKD